MKRRPLTIMEVLLAFGLMALITAFIMTALHNTAHLKKESEIITQRVLERKMVQERLSQIFSHTIPGEDSFYTEEGEEGPQLLFTFDNGIDFDPALCHEVRGTLFQREGNLILRRESLEKKGASREELLLPECGALKFKFLTLGETSTLHESWAKEQKELPYLLSLEMGKEKENLLTYTFLLPSVHPDGVVYK